MPLDLVHERTRRHFALLAKLGHRHDVTTFSMGMSADYQAAVMLGATAVRVGTALFEDGC